MSSMDIPNGPSEIFGDLSPQHNNIMGNLIFVVPNMSLIQKKLNKIETDYKDQIVSKNQFFHHRNTIISMIYEGPIHDFQKIVVEINSIKEIKNFRYLIIN